MVALGLGPRRALADEAVLRRKIPSTGEMLPAIGLGTYDSLAANSAETRKAISDVIGAMLSVGATIVDTASSYKAAEEVIGSVVAAEKLRDKLFIATKMEATKPTEGEAELRQSLHKLQIGRVDLIELHNVADPKQSLAMFRDFKAQGLCRYFGITSTRSSDYAAMEAVVRREKPEFMQVGFSIGDRQAEARLLPTAVDAGAAVLAAQPVGGIHHSLFQIVRGKALPPMAKDIEVVSWAQFFLKYVISHPALTAAIPGTTSAAHMGDDLGAMRGRLPDAAERRQMAAYFDTLR
jgi:diketogulonate reductase-like aldo/keto reductase